MIQYMCPRNRKERNEMNRKQIESNPDFNRARILLKKFKSPQDLIVYWAFSGPCHWEHPAIEDIFSD